MSTYEENNSSKNFRLFKNETNEILMSKETIEKARKSVERMTEIGRQISAKNKPKYINNLVFKALEEDLKPNGDITTKLLNSKITQFKLK